MTRAQNVKKNLIFNVVKYVATLLLQFILRTVLIYYMGAEYLGLNGLFSNILTMLSIFDLGIGSAIVYNLYKPIAKNKIEEITNSLIYSPTNKVINYFFNLVKCSIS